MSVRIVVDSTADLVPELRKKVDTVPLTVHFGKEEYLDGVTISSEKFYKKLTTVQELPSTSQATPFAFGEVFEKLVEKGHTVVALIVSSGLSGTYQSAVIAASDYPGKVFVVDTKQIAISSGIMVTYAMELAEQGMEAEAIARDLTAIRDKVKLMAVVDTLEYLQRGGRVSKTVAIAGGLLAIKPIIGITDGKIEMMGKARGNRQANAMMNKMALEMGIDFSRPFMVGYTGTSDALLQRYLAESAEFFGGQQVPSCIVSAVVGTHAGPNAVALAFFAK